ncbi:MAG: undecaprenyl/decaprenyl-phosphate alpha-N-acetylglucosaminyl 1-phosphate transferase [Planctomycetes bacterium]|nr:undecaprenyl/decaprenyl-phosphate alpha-N-acetylglucosaminyl 1-phosphate transferase [Planctomycetota bacterium]
MLQYVPYVAGVAAAIAVVLGGASGFRRIAWRVGLIDRPKLRGVHSEPVARAGGMALASALLASLLTQMATARALGLHDAYLRDVDNVYLLLPALLLLGLGLLDDIRPLGAPFKLAVQSACAVWAWLLGFQIGNFELMGLVSVAPGWLSLPLTVIFVVAVTNAYNMIDGIDGLCSGASFIALAGIGAYTLLGGEVQLALALPLAAAALAFLRVNLGRPKSFLGDSGSMFLGFLVAALGLRAVRNEAGDLSVAPLFLLLSLPVIDITVAFFRRLLQGNSPLRADRGHIHHIGLLLFGGNVRRTTLSLLTMAAVAAAGALLAGAQPPLAAAAMALPLGLYAMVYRAGGYLSWRNLRAAGPATDLAEFLAAKLDDTNAREVLDDPAFLRLMDACGLTAVALCDEDGSVAFSLGVPDAGRGVLDLPLYAGGRARRGRLLLQGPAKRASALAFASHLLLPLYPAFMDVLDADTRPVPATAATAESSAQREA